MTTKDINIELQIKGKSSYDGILLGRDRNGYNIIKCDGETSAYPTKNQLKGMIEVLMKWYEEKE